MAKANSNRKGKVLEREVCNILKDNGVPAKRISMMETAGEDMGDIEIAGTWIGQVKGGSHVPKFIYSLFKHDEHMAFVRRDRKKWKIIMDLDFFLSKFI